MGGPDFSLDSDSGLFINSPSGNESGEFICTASNAAGSSTRKVQLTVYGNPHQTLYSIFFLFFYFIIKFCAFCTKLLYLPDCVNPVRPRSNVDRAGISKEPVRMSVIEGVDAVLPCEVHSVPPPTISWAKERQLISPFSPR